VIGIGGALMGGGLFFARVLLVSLKQQYVFSSFRRERANIFALNPEATNYYDY
jgi:hypothetical protein